MIGLDVLTDMMIHARFPEEELEKETGVILQELQMYKDQPRNWMLMNAKKRYHGDNPYGWPIIGSEQTIQSVTIQSLMNHKNALYTKDNLILVVAGKIENEQEILDFLEKELCKLPQKSSLIKTPYANIKPSQHSGKLTQ